MDNCVPESSEIRIFLGHPVVGKCLKGDSGAAPCRAFEDPVMKFSWEISTGKRPQLFPRAFKGSVCVAGGVDLVGFVLGPLTL